MRTKKNLIPCTLKIPITDVRITVDRDGDDEVIQCIMPWGWTRMIFAILLILEEGRRILAEVLMD